MVSVIIATYRREESLKKAIESLKKQTYENIEIVVVDDNANVEWNKKVQKIIEENTDVKYIQNIENKGSAETRNIGIRNANGEYITFLDDDDLYLPNKVQRQVEFMKLNQLDYCVTDLDLYYENGKLCERRNRKFIKDTSSQQLLKYHLTYKITGMDTMMFQKKYLQKIGGFAPINYGDEFYLMQRAIEGNGAFGYLEGSDIMAFVHTKEQGMSIGAGKIKGENEVYAHIKRYFNILNGKEKKYIKMRHHAVLAFAYVRQKKYLQFFWEGIKSFFSSPIGCLKLLIKGNG